MSSMPEETTDGPVQFDFSAYPPDTLFLDRRTLPPHPSPGPASDAPKSSVANRPRKDRRRRVDPTTFEKQYTEDELEFMNAVQSFKIRSGKLFPTHGDILRVALGLGYRKSVPLDERDDPDDFGEVVLLPVCCGSPE